MTVLVTDRQSYTITRREFTDNGYLRVPGRVARTGIQEYLAKELQLTDREPNSIVRVYRPAEEVFAPDSLASYDNADITDDHPSDMVDAASFKKVAVGHAVSPGTSDGDFVVVDMLIKDQAAIDAIQSGKLSLSAGYEAEYVREPGQTTDGQDYEFVQRNIRINHVALVDRARAGHEARLYDSKHTPQETQMKVITLDKGRTVEVADDATAQLVQSTLDAYVQQVKDAEAKAKEAEDMSEEQKAKLDKMNEDMEAEKAKTSDAAIAERLEAITKTRDQARTIAGDKFACDSVDLNTIKRAALSASRPNVAWADKSDHYVQVAWDMEMEKDEDEREKEKAKASHDAFGKDMSNLYAGDNGQMVGDAAYGQFLKGGK